MVQTCDTVGIAVTVILFVYLYFFVCVFVYNSYTTEHCQCVQL